jgi:uncharacterized protein YtpQ (UPF0354 family)
MSLFDKLFGKSKKDQSNNIQPQTTGSLIDLQKVFPRIKGLFDNENPDPVRSSVEIAISVDDAPVIKPLAEGIGICYMIDKGDSYQVIQNKHLSTDLTIDKLHDAALTNMAIAISDKTQVNGDPKNAMMVTNGGNLEAAMLLADFLWEQIEPVFEDKICVAIPANDLLFIAGKNSSVGRQTLRTLVKQYFDNSETKGLIVRHIYERDN